MSSRIRPSVKEDLKEFCEEYGLSSQSNGVQALLEIVSTLGIGEAKGGEDSDVVVKFDEESNGFVVPDGVTEANLFIPSEEDKSYVINRSVDNNAKAEPFGVSTLMEADVYCPACGNRIFQYDLVDFLPRIPTGTFSEFTTECPHCGSSRDGDTLITVDPNVDPSEELFHNIIEYWGYLLMVKSLPFEEFKEKVLMCERVAIDAGWNWLPRPKRWIGFGDGGFSSIEPNDFVRFFGVYLRVRSENSTKFNISAIAPSVHKSSGSGFLLGFSITDGSLEEVQQEINKVTNSWELANVSAEFAPDGGEVSNEFDAKLVFEGLTEVN